MKITLIMPNISHLFPEIKLYDGCMEPLQIAVLAGLCKRNDQEVVFYDDRLEEIPYDEPTDLVGITVETFSARRSYEIAREYQERGVRVIMGGIHVSLLPDEAEKHADSIVIGDVERIWDDIMEDLKYNRLQKRYYGNVILPQYHCFPDREVFKGKKYLPVTLIQFSRGCKYNCTFCAVSQYFKQSHHCRKNADVIQEIEEDKKRMYLFVDDNITAEKEVLKQFLRELIPMKIKWVSQASIEMTEDLELMNLMAESGCMGNLIGFDSITTKGLRSYHKAPNLINFNKYEEPIRVLRDFGMLNWAAFVFGNDCDTIDSLKRTVDFAVSNRFTLAYFNLMMPYPGTPVYEQLKKENRLLYDSQWWNHPDYRYNRSAFVPAQMTPDVLSEATIKANRDFYSYTSIGNRLLDLKTNFRNPLHAVVYLYFNLLLKKTGTSK